MQISDFSTEALAAELQKRPDLLDKDGIMPFEVYKLMCQIQPFPCVDGIAVRRNRQGTVEAMAIRRGTGAEKGKLCSTGGRILRNESIEECLRRQFRTDMNCEIDMLVLWQTPVIVLQCAPAEQVAGKNFGPEYGKHTTSLYYPVRLRGEPSFGRPNGAPDLYSLTKWI